MSKEVNLQKAWTELENGRSLRRTAKKHRVSHPTLLRKLRQNDKKRYALIMNSMDPKNPAVKRSRALSKVNAELLKEFESGTSLGDLSRKYGFYKRTLQRRFMNIYGNKYKEFIKTRRVGFGLRTGLGDSELETEIMKLLEENDIRFNFHTTLSVEGHRYIPDFMVGDNTLIEVTGMTIRRYWEHTSEKLKRYIKSGYRVILVIQRRKLKSVQHYFPRLSKWFVVVKYEELKANFHRYLGTIMPTTENV